ncbi:MAG: hypothetical protein VX346_21520 [Planctomycetota bacterium]|nr:hypothetical protein [Planctomycetota bacterium]
MSARLVGIAAALLLTVVVGCDTVEDIRNYEVPTEKSLYDANHIAPDLKADGEAPDRMLGAIVPLGTQVWFFKIVGAQAAVAAQQAAWQQFVDSLRFAGEASPQPSWTLPAGWVQAPSTAGTSGGMVTRFATIRIDGPAKLEMSVTALPTPRGAPQSAVLMNVNRWRGQLQLPLLKNKFWLEETTRQTEIAASETLAALRVTLVDLLGTRDPSGGGPMMAGRGPTGRPAPGGPGRGAPAAGGPGFSYTKPENWQPGRTSSIRRAAFTVRDGGQEVEITVFKLPASGLLANVSRWAGQIGMEPLTGEDQLGQVTSDLPVGDLVATYVELKGTQDRVTLAAILPDRGEPQMAWFFKLSGPAGSAPVALREKAPFRSFVQSVVVGGTARPPAARPPAARPPAARPAAQPPAATANPGFRYTQPSGWLPGRTSSIRRAAFKVSSGGQEVEITVFKLPASGLLPNVSRWAGQIGGQPLTSEAQLAKVVSDLPVGDQVAKFVELVGTEKRVTLAAILPDRQEPQMAWFFKLSGPAGSGPLVQREKTKFRQFVQSVQLGP